jgi:hypothetical protein
MKKTTILFLTVICLHTTWSCHEDDLDSETPVSATTKDSKNREVDSRNGRLSTIFREDVGSQITQDEAKKMIENFKSRSQTGPEGFYVGKNTFERLLKSGNAVGIFIYNGVTADGQPTLVLVGIDKEGNLLTSPTENGFEDKLWVCPPDCPQ